MKRSVMLLKWNLMRIDGPNAIWIELAVQLILSLMIHFALFAGMKLFKGIIVYNWAYTA
jgi:hypothetical protein